MSELQSTWTRKAIRALHCLALWLFISANATGASTTQVPVDWHLAVTGRGTDTALGPIEPAIILSCPGCCSSHGGIGSSCAANGHIYCRDGTASPTCLCSTCGVSPPPTCTGGQYYDGTRCVCPGNQVLINGQCTTLPTCTNGHVLVGTACVCPTGQTEINGVCTTPPAFSITPGISGNWYNPTQSGHGFQIEILKSPAGYATVFWFVFDNYRNPAWITGVGPIQGNKVVMSAGRRLGAQFPPLFRTTDAVGTAWGTLTLTFSDCTHGHVTWTSTDSAFSSSGGMDIVRLTELAGTSCP